MFERFTDRARKVMALANQEALRFNHGYIGAEHILLGMIKERDNAGAQVLRDIGVDLTNLFETVERALRPGTGEVGPKIPQTPQSKAVVERSIRRARDLGHQHIGTEHMVVALVEDEGVAGAAMRECGATRETVDMAARRLAAGEFDSTANAPNSDPKQPTAMPEAQSAAKRRYSIFERFTDRARKVMAFANQEAQRCNHEYIGTEHILLGLAKEGSGVGANVLKNLGAELATIRTEVERLVKAGPELITMGKLPQTPRAKKVIEYAIEEARGLGHHYVGTEHLLLGLLREEDGVAACVLMSLGLHLTAIREEVLNLLAADIDDKPSPAAPASPPPYIQPRLAAYDLTPELIFIGPYRDNPVVRAFAFILALADLQRRRVAAESADRQFKEKLDRFVVGLIETGSNELRQICQALAARRSSKGD